MQNRVEYFFFLLLTSFLRLFPFRTVQRFGSAFGRFVFSVLRLRRNLVLDNLRHAYPEKSEEERIAIGLASTQNLFMAYFEIAVMDTLTREELMAMIRFADAAAVDEVLEEGKGTIFLSGHFGNWELLALTVPLFSRHQHRHTLIVQKQRNPFINDFMTRMRARFGTNVVVMERALRESLRALSDGKGIALIADQSGPESGIYTEFFGRPVSTHQGPAVFQVRSGAPIVLILLVREGWGKFRIVMERVDLSGISGTEEEKMQEVTQRHVSALERHIRQHPDHWLWMHKRWKHTASYLAKQSAQGKA